MTTAAAQLSRIILMVGRRQRPRRPLSAPPTSATTSSHNNNDQMGTSPRTSSRSALEEATFFYQQTLGLTVLRATDEWTEFVEVPLSLHVTIVGPPNDRNDSDGQDHDSSIQQQQYLHCLPILQFTIPDMNSTVAQGLSLGADLDGPIHYPAHGKVATLRTPDGHRIGLYEPAHD